MMSLGQYLSSLRLVGVHDDGNDENNNEQVVKVLKKQLEITMGKMLLKYFGKTYGAALLPVMGTDSADSYLTNIASKIATWVATQIIANGASSVSGGIVDHMNQDGTGDENGNDLGTLPLSLAEFTSILNMNQKSGGGTNMTMTPLALLQKGEVDIFEHNFEGLIPNPFIVETDFEETITKMENRIRAFKAKAKAEAKAKNATEQGLDIKDVKDDDDDEHGKYTYDPHDKSAPEPTPINERILPDLYLGVGNGCYSHTKREILVNRLTSILLTKLCYNYYKKANFEKDLFEVHYHAESCHHPDEFIQALINNGHTVDVCPRTQISNFGVSLSVKEDDDSWTAIPIAYMMRTGLERYSDNQAVTFAAPHGGMDFYITGPLIGQTNTCAIQFYIAYQGLCAFHADHDIIMPWKKKASLASPYSNDKALRAARMAGLVSIAYSKIATEMELPFGGYGMMGMCNDISGFIDLAINGETAAYPLTSTGKYLCHFMRCLMELQGDLKERVGMEYAVGDIQKLIHSIANIDNDLHMSPAGASNSLRRYKKAYPEICFQSTADSIQNLREISEMYESLTVWAKVSQYL
jgi:hypothetical protein